MSYIIQINEEKVKTINCSEELALFLNKVIDSKQAKTIVNMVDRLSNVNVVTNTGNNIKVSKRGA